ncbi:MAG: molybdopterin-guanine dinucleotide biosynthesis protein B [Magnetovibrionaceae bacterium]
MKVFGLVGWSGSGKTTLMIELVPELVRRGLKVSTMKHTHHNFDIDKRGKDSYEHRRAGATEVMVASSARWALMHELRAEPEEDMQALIDRMTPVDLLLIEGFKRHKHPKMEIHRPVTGKELLAAGDESIVAVATDGELDGLRQPQLDLNDVPAIADFILKYCGLSVDQTSGAA